MKLGLWPKFQKLHIYFLSAPAGGEIEVIFALQAAVSEILAAFQNCPIFRHEIGPLVKVPEVAHTFFLSQGAKLSLFSLYREPSLIYWPIFKIAIFGHETWPLAKVPEVAHILSFYPGGGGGGN